jgi:hypothetical protein
VDAIPELKQARDLGQEAPEEYRETRKAAAQKSTASASSRRMKDAKRKKAIEMHAVTTIMDIYRADNFDVADVGLTKSWDITALRDGQEVHIEVKGSTGTRDAVDLTDGEVRHAEGDVPTILAVVDQIKVGDRLRCSGGRIRMWQDWVPDRGVLVPTAYRYPLPAISS